MFGGVCLEDAEQLKGYVSMLKNTLLFRLENHPFLCTTYSFNLSSLIHCARELHSVAAGLLLGGFMNTPASR